MIELQECKDKCFANEIGRRERTSEAYQPKPDTIIAIGYAERQKAETLRMAGRVNTEL